MKATIARSLTALVLTGAAVVGGAPPAVAATQGTRPCPSYYYCFYQYSNFNGYSTGQYNSSAWKLQYQSTTFGHFDRPPFKEWLNARDSLSSIINNTNKRICIYNVIGNNHYLIVNVAPYQDYYSVWYDNMADYWRVVGGSSRCP